MNKKIQSPLNEIETAAYGLAASETGRQALSDLHAFLDRRGCALDDQNQRRCATLLTAAWGGKAGSVLDAMESALKQ